MGMIGKVSRIVLNRATHDCASWPDSVNISINLSAIDFRRSRLLEEIDKPISSPACAGARSKSR
jgi:predicted signal transduction protein with EAL and GGDEF domain